MVSVIIPVFNSENTIINVLDAIESQTMVNLINEIIVINDGSTDKSKDIIRKYGERSKSNIVIIDISNHGVSHARNLGVKYVKSSDWIAFCDSDDVWLPNKLERLFKVIDRYPCIDCIGSAFSEKPLRIGLKIIKKIHKASVKDILLTNFPQPSTVLIKKTVFDAIGGFDEKQRYAEDGNFFLRVAAKFNLYYLPEQLIVYGNGKRAFGVGGLSSNLKAMYAGNVKNMREMCELGYISWRFYICMRIYHWLKYCRRITITILTK